MQKENTKYLYQEQQKLTGNWIWFLLLMVCFFLIFALVQEAIFKTPFDILPLKDWVLASLLAVPLFFVVVMIFSKLSLSISETQIEFRYTPFNKPRIIKLEDISELYIRIYKPMRDYGGWGWITGLSKEMGRAYNVSGNKGMQIVLKNGRRILIGTQNPRALHKVLTQLNLP